MNRSLHAPRALLALALPTAALAAVAMAPAPAAHAANPAPDCVLHGTTFSCTVTYAYAGAEDTFTVPVGVAGVDVVAVGGSGGQWASLPGGRGSVVQGTVPVTAGSTLYVAVGGTGVAAPVNQDVPGSFNGGGASWSGATGGGATDLRTVSRAEDAAGSLASRVVVAGGGGGSDDSAGGDAGLVGGHGGNSAAFRTTGGQGATQTSGGAPGTAPSLPGALGLGGDGKNGGSGGGGGLYGGGGGGNGSGGGGGSSLVPANGTVAANTTNGAPRLEISYESDITDATGLSPSASPAQAGDLVEFGVVVTDGVASATARPDSLSISPTTAGTECSATACLARRPGTYTVTGTFAGFTASTTFVVTPGPLASLDVAPGISRVATGDAVVLTATGADTFGNPLGDQTGATSFAITPVGGGDPVACPDATCTPTAAGTYRVTATQGDVVGRASIAVDVLATTASLDLPATPVYGDAVSATGSVVTDGDGVPDGPVRLVLDGDEVGAPTALDARGGVSYASLGELDAGLHTVRLEYDGSGGFGPSTATGAFVVAKAPTITTLDVSAGALAAEVDGGETSSPTGTVRFLIDGTVVGTAPVDGDGVASYTGDTTRTTDSTVAAVYSGAANFEASSASTARTNPVLTGAASATGWQKAPVTVTFSCSGGTGTYTCPAGVVVSGEGAAQYVTRTVVTDDGAVSTATVGPIDLDRTAPAAQVKGVRAGATYNGLAPRAGCQGTDALSGVVSCDVVTVGAFPGPVTSTATVTDAAGNVRSTSTRYTVRDLWVGTSTVTAGAWNVKLGRSVTLHLVGGDRPSLTNPLRHRTDRLRYAGVRGDQAHWVSSFKIPTTARPGKVYRFTLKQGSATRVVKVRAVR